MKFQRFWPSRSGVGSCFQRAPCWFLFIATFAIYPIWPCGSEAFWGPPWAEGWNVVSIQKSHIAKVNIRPWLHNSPKFSKLSEPEVVSLPQSRVGRGSQFSPLAAGTLWPALWFLTAGSPWEPDELNFQLTELAHSPAEENSPIINIQNLSWDQEVELKPLA